MKKFNVIIMSEEKLLEDYFIDTTYRVIDYNTFYNKEEANVYSRIYVNNGYQSQIIEEEVDA